MSITQKIHSLLFFFLSIYFSAAAQSVYRINTYDDVTANIQEIDRMAQDKTGFLWLSTCDGLYRFDGYKLQGFRPTDAVDVNISSDEIDRMHVDDNGNLWCVIGNRAYIFNTRTHTFCDVLSKLEEKNGRKYIVRNIRPITLKEMILLCDGGIAIAAQTNNPELSARIIINDGSEEIDMNVKNNEAWLTTTKNRYIYYNGKCKTTNRIYISQQPDTLFHTDRFGKQWQNSEINAPGLDKARMIFKDNQDNVWYFYDRRLVRISFHPVLYTHIKEETEPMRCAMLDNKQRTWVANRNNRQIAIYDSNNKLIGYLAPNGAISRKPVEFSSLAYAMLNDSHGNIWIGTKPHGLYRLREKTNGSYTITNYRKETSGVHDNEIIGLVEDKHGRIWACGFKEGLMCVSGADGNTPVIQPIPNNTQKHTHTQIKFRRIIITKTNAILAATSGGLIVYNINQPIEKLQKGVGITLHQKEAERENSMGCTPLKSVIETSNGNIYICTRDKGIDKVTSDNIFSKTLTFEHYNTQTGFPANYPKSIIEIDRTLWITALNTITEWHPDKPLPTGASTKVYIRGSDFADCDPVMRADGSWLYGVVDGTVAINMNRLDALGSSKLVSRLPIVLTSTIDTDTITLGTDNRTLSLSFATLDYGNSYKKNYAIRLLSNNEGKWQYLGDVHDIVFHNLKPGEYTLQIRATNSGGEWLDTQRNIYVVVKAKFTETIWARLLMQLIILLIVVAIITFYIYVRRLRRKHRETLDAYLQLLSHSQQRTPMDYEAYRTKVVNDDSIEPQNDKFIKKVVEYIDIHISDADIDIDQMAQYAAVSRSHLNHKLKQLLGVTPSEMIREARIKHACTLLNDPNRSINDVAYACGFTDPKYFSKCFKISTGISPTKYRTKEDEELKMKSEE